MLINRQSNLVINQGDCWFRTHVHGPLPRESSDPETKAAAGEGGWRGGKGAGGPGPGPGPSLGPEAGATNH